MSYLGVTRYIGSAVVSIQYVGGPKDEYRGHVIANGRTWFFRDLFAPAAGFSFAYDSPKAYDRMAASAMTFGSYYTSDNPPAMLGDRAGYPDARTADAIRDAACTDDQGRYPVRRSINGPERTA